MSGGGLHRDGSGNGAYQGDEAETLVAEEGVKVAPHPMLLYRSALDAPVRVKAGLPVVLAVVLHLAVFTAALLLPKLLGSATPLRKPIIARMVALGKPRDQKLLPRKEEAAAPAPSSGPKSAPAPAIAPPSRSTPGKLAAAPKAPAPRRQPSNEERMQRALDSVALSVDRDRESLQKEEERVGSETGSPEGTAQSAEEGDAYFALVQAEILRHYELPSIISERERMSLKATVVAWIASDGAIVKYTFEHRSGNHFFDDALERAIKSSKVPPPPPDRARAIRDDGVALVFTP